MYQCTEEMSEYVVPMHWEGVTQLLALAHGSSIVLRGEPTLQEAMTWKINYVLAKQLQWNYNYLLGTE